MAVSLIALVTALLGLGLIILAFRRFKQAPAQAIGLMLVALLINSWWIAFLVMFLFKTMVLKQDT